MTRTHIRTIAVVTGHDQPKLSKGQQAFNKLIKQIEKKRVQLADWETAIPLYQQKYVSELLPLVKDLMDMQVKFLHSLDRACDHTEIKKSERGMIASLIVELAGELLASRDDKELNAVYNKHSHSDYDKKEAANIKGMKAMMEDVLGVDLGDDFDMSSPEDLFKRVQAQMAEEFEQEKLGKSFGPSEKNRPNSSPRKRRSRPRSNRSAYPSARSTGNWPAPCTRIANPTRRSASEKPP